MSSSLRKRVEKLERQLALTAAADVDLELGKVSDLSNAQFCRFLEALKRRYEFWLEDIVGASFHDQACSCRVCEAYQRHGPAPPERILDS